VPNFIKEKLFTRVAPEPNRSDRSNRKGSAASTYQLETKGSQALAFQTKAQQEQTLWEDLKQKSKRVVSVFHAILHSSSHSSLPSSSLSSEKPRSRALSQTSLIDLDKINPNNFLDLEKPELVLRIRSMIRQVLACASEKEQLRFLSYYFGATVEESFHHFSSTYYALTMADDGSLRMTDSHYRHNAEFGAMLQSSIAHAESVAHKTRYIKEAQQVEQLLFRIKTGLLADFPHASLTSLENLSAQALQKLSWVETRSILPDKTAKELGVEPDVLCLAGKKHFYTMPQSEIHPGGFSAVVVTQTIYIPEIDRCVQLHSQILTHLEWGDHYDLLQKLSVNLCLPKPQLLSKKSEKDLETDVMGHLVELETKYQGVNLEFALQEILQDLMPQQQKADVLLENYARFFQQALKMETQAFGGLTASSIRRIYHFFRRFFIAEISHLTPLTDKMLQKKIRLYQNLMDQDETQETAIAMTLQKSGGNINLGGLFGNMGSMFECGFGGMANINPNAISGASGGSRNPLSFGHHRSHSCENHNTCPNCGTHVKGNVCLNCGAVRPGSSKKDYKRGAEIKNGFHKNAKSSSLSSLSTENPLNFGENPHKDNLPEVKPDPVGLSFLVAQILGVQSAGVQDESQLEQNLFPPNPFASEKTPSIISPN